MCRHCVAVGSVGSGRERQRDWLEISTEGLRTFFANEGRRFDEVIVACRSATSYAPQELKKRLRCATQLLVRFARSIDSFAVCQIAYENIVAQDVRIQMKLAQGHVAHV